MQGFCSNGLALGFTITGVQLTCIIDCYQGGFPFVFPFVYQPNNSMQVQRRPTSEREMDDIGQIIVFSGLRLGRAAMQPFPPPVSVPFWASGASVPVKPMAMKDGGMLGTTDVDCVTLGQAGPNHSLLPPTSPCSGPPRRPATPEPPLPSQPAPPPKPRNKHIMNPPGRNAAPSRQPSDPQEPPVADPQAHPGRAVDVYGRDCGAQAEQQMKDYGTISAAPCRTTLLPMG